MISRNKKQELSGLMEVSALWWSWDKSWKSLVLFINSRSLHSHIKCSKLREMNFTMINCATNTIDNENLLCGFICMVAGKTQVMLRLLIYNWNFAYQNSIYSKCNSEVYKDKHNLAFRFHSLTVYLLWKGKSIYHCAPLHWVGEHHTVSWTGYFLWILKMSLNLGLST